MILVLSRFMKLEERLRLLRGHAQSKAC